MFLLRELVIFCQFLHVTNSSMFFYITVVSSWWNTSISNFISHCFNRVFPAYIFVLLLCWYFCLHYSMNQNVNVITVCTYQSSQASHGCIRHYRSHTHWCPLPRTFLCLLLIWDLGKPCPLSSDSSAPLSHCLSSPCQVSHSTTAPTFSHPKL